MKKTLSEWALAAKAFASRNRRVLFAAAVAAFAAYEGYGYFTQPKQTGTKFDFSEFMKQVDDGKISDISIDGHDVKGHLKDGTEFKTILPTELGISKDLVAKNIRVEVPEGGIFTFSNFFNFVFFPMLILSSLAQAGVMGKALNFGANRARLVKERPVERFSDVAGIDEVKQDLQEIVDFLKDPGKFGRLGGKIPKGVLLTGGPGVGKTLIAKAVAGEANVPYFWISGSDFVEMFAGTGASRVRSMFNRAKKSTPCIIFIDELDALGRSRDSRQSNEEREQALNQLLVEMDGFETRDGIILIAATNRPDVLDQALVRPGRFDRQIGVPNPDVRGREDILKIHTRDKKLAPGAKLNVIAQGTPGFSGADLANLANEAAILAARRNKDVIDMQEFEDAKDKIMMGAERKSLMLTPEERQLTSYHEGGHTIVSLYTEGSDPLYKVSIVPRSKSLGVTINQPLKDKTNYTLEQLEAILTRLYGGREAEILTFGPKKVTTGAADDIIQATRIAEQMVMRFGMSEHLGRVSYDDESGYIFSADTGRLIDTDVRKITEDAEGRAREILKTRKTELGKLAAELLARETLTGDEVYALLPDAPRPKTDTTIAAVSAAAGGATP